MRKRINKDATGLAPSKTEFGTAKARRAVEGLIKASKGIRLRGLKIKDLINEGRD